MTTSSPPDVIDVIPVLRPDRDDAPTLLQRWRAALLRRRWSVVGAAVLLVLAVLVWRTTRPLPFVLTGQVEAQEINLVAPGAGVITRLLVLPGQEIDAGASLFELDGVGGAGTSAASAAAQAASLDPAAAANAATAAAGGASQGAAAAAASAASAGTSTSTAAGAAAASTVSVTVVTPAVLQARAELDRSRVDTARFERAAELAYAAYQRAVGLYEDSMIEAGARDAAQQQWNTADAQVRAARARHEQVRRRAEAVLADAPQRSVVVAAPAAAPASAPAAAPARAVSVAAAAGAAGVAGVAGRQTLRAPLAGEIDRIGVTAGTRVVPGQWLMSLVNLSDVWVVAVVREDRLASYAFGTRHQAEIPVLSARLELRVDSLSQLPDFATWRGVGGAELRSFEVRLRADTAAPGLRPGMAVVFAPR
jgi:HlyD family secretion protein